MAISSKAKGQNTLSACLTYGQILKIERTITQQEEWVSKKETIGARN